MPEGKTQPDSEELINYPNYLGADESKFGPKTDYEDKPEPDIDDMSLPERDNVGYPNYLGADEKKFGPQSKEYSAWHAKRTLADTEKYEGDIEGQKQKAFDVVKQGASIENKRELSRQEIMDALNKSEDPTITINTPRGPVTFKLNQIAKVYDGINVILTDTETIKLEEDKS